MPIAPKYSWEETDESLHVTVLLPSARSKPVDVYVADQFIKVNSPPHLLHLDLSHDVDFTQSSHTITPQGVEIRVPKKQQGNWGELLMKGVKGDILARRLKSLARREVYDRETQSKAKDAKAAAAKGAWQQQWEEEKTHKHAISTVKSDEKKEAEDDLSQWQDTLTPSAPASDDQKGALQDKSRTPKQQQQQQQQQQQHQQQQQQQRQQALHTAAPLPPVRKGGTIQIKFTETEVTRKGAPARQSTSAKLEQKRLADSKAPDPDARDISDEHSVFLKQKGDRFYKAKAFRPAINAYTDAIERDPFNAACYANRAACYLQLAGQGGTETRLYMKKCLADCSAGMEHADDSTRVTLLARRGAAHAAMGQFRSALEDLRAAIELDSDNLFPELADDATQTESLLRAIEAGEDANHVKRALEAAQQGDWSTTVEAYTATLELNPSNTAAFCGRSSALLAAGAHRRCVEDCEQALALLREAGDYADQLLWYRVLRNQAAAFTWLEQLQEAREASAKALAIAKKHQNASQEWDVSVLERDIERLESRAKATLLCDKAKAAVGTGDHKQACDFFSQALVCCPDDPAALVNRSACRLALGQAHDCINDCEAALRILETSLGSAQSKASQPTAKAGQGAWWVRLSQLKATCHIRLGTVLCATSKLVHGRVHYEKGAALLSLLVQSGDLDEAAQTRVLDASIQVEQDLTRIDDMIRAQSSAFV